MAHKICPIIPCITRNRSTTSINLPTNDDAPLDALRPLVFCTDVFSPINACSKESTDPKTCWYCHIENTAREKFVATKSSDPIPDEIRQLQEKLDFNPGEPVTKDNFRKIIPSWRYRIRQNRPKESTSRVMRSVPFSAASSSSILPSLKRKCEKDEAPPLQKYASDRCKRNFSAINVTSKTLATESEGKSRAMN